MRIPCGVLPSVEHDLVATHTDWRQAAWAGVVADELVVASRARAPWKNPVLSAPIGILPTVDEYPEGVAGESEIAIQTLQEIASDGLRRLDLDRNPALTDIDDDVDLTAI
jgi:hypothetical protein